MPRKAAASTAAKTTPVVEPVATEVSTPSVAPQSAPAAKRAAKPTKPALTPDTYVTIRNGFQGKLIYESPHTGETFVWEGFGAEQEMELQELKHAKNSSKAYFENNWFLFDDPAVIEYLGVQRFYEGSLIFSEIDSLFTMTPEEVAHKLSVMPRGQKKTLEYRARQMIRDGRIDSLRVIGALESGLGIKLVER